MDWIELAKIRAQPQAFVTKNKFLVTVGIYSTSGVTIKLLMKAQFCDFDSRVSAS
jgi:hypothetical protein